MTESAPNHYSHSFVLNLDKLPTKKSDRIALQILYPGIIFGLILVLLGVVELFNGLNHGKTDFDFIPEDEDIFYQPFMNPTFFDIVIILIGLGIVCSLIFSYIRYKKIFFDGKKVQIISRPVFGAKKSIKESLENYEGVRFRIEFFQFGFMNKNKYIIELYHKNPKKIAPLYISTKSKNIRKIWEYYAKKLNMPTIILTDEGEVKRDVCDLDKSMKEMIKEGKYINNFNERDPLPPSIAYVRKRDKTVIKARKIFWDAYNILIGLGLLVLGSILLCVAYHHNSTVEHFSREFAFGLYISGILVILASIFVLFRKDKIVVKKDKIVLVHKFMLFSRKNTEIMKKDIEAVDVTVNPATGRYFLSIISDERTAVFGKKIPIEELRWVKKFLINEVVNS